MFPRGSVCDSPACDLTKRAWRCVHDAHVLGGHVAAVSHHLSIRERPGWPSAGQRPCARGSSPHPPPTCPHACPAPAPVPPPPRRNPCRVARGMVAPARADTARGAPSLCQGYTGPVTAAGYPYNAPGIQWVSDWSWVPDPRQAGLARAPVTPAAQSECLHPCVATTLAACCSWRVTGPLTPSHRAPVWYLVSGIIPSLCAPLPTESGMQGTMVRMRPGCHIKDTNGKDGRLVLKPSQPSGDECNSACPLAVPVSRPHAVAARPGRRAAAAKRARRA